LVKVLLEIEAKLACAEYDATGDKSAALTRDFADPADFINIIR
jgi:hypothetical protein